MGTVTALYVLTNSTYDSKWGWGGESSRASPHGDVMDKRTRSPVVLGEAHLLFSSLTNSTLILLYILHLAKQRNGRHPPKKKLNCKKVLNKKMLKSNNNYAF